MQVQNPDKTYFLYESPISSKNELKKCGLKVSSSQRNAKKSFYLLKWRGKKTLSEALLSSICSLTYIIFFAKNRTCIKDLLFCTLTFKFLLSYKNPKTCVEAELTELKLPSFRRTKSIENRGCRFPTVCPSLHLIIASYSCNNLSAYLNC